jgi:hypothetical protein
MSMSVSDVPVFGVIADECALALESMLLRKAAIAWLALVSIILMCDCLNCRLFGMMEKCMRPSVALGGNGKLVVFRINARISSGVVFIGTVKWTKDDVAISGVGGMTTEDVVRARFGLVT